jgi:hypothetical protein
LRELRKTLVSNIQGVVQLVSFEIAILAEDFTNLIEQSQSLDGRERLGSPQDISI